MTHSALDGKIMSTVGLDSEFVTLMGTALISFGAVHSALIKGVVDSSADPVIIQKKLMKRMVGKSIKPVNNAFKDIDFLTDSIDDYGYSYDIDDNGDIQIQSSKKRGLRKPPSIMGRLFTDLVYDRNKIAHSMAIDSGSEIMFGYVLDDGNKGRVTVDFLKHFIRRCDSLAEYIVVYKQLESEISQEATA